MTTEAEFEWTPVAKVGEIPPGRGRLVRPAGGPLRLKPMAVFNENGRYFILNYICPHQGGPLGEGVIEDGVVTCPYHGWSFQADTGVGAHTPLGHGTHAYEVRVEGEDILVGPLKPWLSSE